MHLVQKKLDERQLELVFLFDDDENHEIEIYDSLSKASKFFYVNSKLNFYLSCQKESKLVNIIIYKDGKKSYYLRTRLCAAMEEIEEPLQDLGISLANIHEQSNSFYDEVKRQWGEEK